MWGTVPVWGCLVVFAEPQPCRGMDAIWRACKQIQWLAGQEDRQSFSMRAWMKPWKAEDDDKQNLPGSTACYRLELSIQRSVLAWNSASCQVLTWHWRPWFGVLASCRWLGSMMTMWGVCCLHQLWRATASRMSSVPTIDLRELGILQVQKK